MINLGTKIVQRVAKNKSNAGLNNEQTTDRYLEVSMLTYFMRTIDVKS